VIRRLLLSAHPLAARRIAIVAAILWCVLWLLRKAVRS